MVPDFVALPPEINSARMYAGPRSGSMWAAAAAWDGLAAALGSAASSFQSTVSGLSAAWQGPGSLAMAAAAIPYVQWLSAASAQAELVANEARLSAGAFETAFAATVPPPVIAANRAELMTLIATNILGQNTAAIAANEAEYAEMWAQDVTAMTGYDASATAAEAQWTPFSQPPATLPGAGTSAQSVVSIAPQLLSPLTRSSLLSTLQTTASRLEMLSTPAEFALEPMNMVMGQLFTGGNPLSGAASSMPAIGPNLMSTVSPGMGTLSSVPPSAPAVSAGMGQAGSVGTLSVPASWANSVAPGTPAQAVAGAPTTGGSQVAAGVPRMPQLPSMSMPGRAVSAVSPAVAEPRAAAVPR